MADFQRLQHIAILGLNNHSGDLPVPPEVTEVYRERADENPALRFLDLASLSHGYECFASLPKKGAAFDELPKLPAETLPTLSKPLAEQTAWRLSAPTLLGFALLLFKANKVLPEAWLLPALKLAATDNTLRIPVQLTLSAKARWLIELNPDWQSLKLDEQPGRWPLAQQLKLLQTLDGAFAVDWTTTHWTEAAPEQRAQWLSVLHGLPATELTALLALHAQERSAKSRRPLRRLIAMKHLDDTQERATALLGLYLSRSAGLLKSKLTVQAPETLSPELTALGIDDQDLLLCNQVKPVLRLGQLLVLAGVEGIAACLNQPVEDSYASLAGSKFKGELAPFLLEAALWSQNPAALTAWCTYFKDEKCHRFSLANALVGIDKNSVALMLTEMTRQELPLWADAEVYNWLTRHDVNLDSRNSRFACTTEIKRNNYAALIRLVSVLALESVQDVITTLETHEGTPRLLPEFLTVLRFRIALENEQ